jgi:hypothetical protein
MSDHGSVRYRRLATLVGAVVITAAAITVAVSRHATTPPPPQCVASAGRVSYVLDVEQAANAATIAAIGRQAGLPDHAVTVALAAALQESKLHNLDYGDRDSVGLFQQRPSQGWGPRAELMVPTYAATAFYAKLRTVPGWATMPVADAAQSVQRSASGQAYAQWEGEARLVARALTGEVSAGLRCRFASPARTTEGALGVAVAAELGSGVLGSVLPRARGWSTASWLVANAYRYGIRAVSFDGRTWTNSPGRWRAEGSATNTIRVHRFRVSALAPLAAGS